MDMTGEVRPESTVIVVTGGDPSGPQLDRQTCPGDARVVAADSGADTALALGLRRARDGRRLRLGVAAPVSSR